MKEADENDFGAGVEKELDKEAMVSDNSPSSLLPKQVSYFRNN